MIQLIYELDHFSVLLRTIQWFLFYFWIKYRALVVAYKGIHNLAASLVSVPPLSPTSCSFCQCFSSVQLCHSVVSDSLRPHELQHARPPCPSPTPRVHPNSCPLSQWCHLILCCPLLLLPPIPPSIRVFSNEFLWRREWLSSPVFLPGEFHGQRSLVGYSLWVCKESDTTEWPHTHIIESRGLLAWFCCKN